MTIRALFPLSAVLAALAAGPAPAADFEAQVRKFAADHCVSCHGPDMQRGRLRLDTLPTNLADKDTAAAWVKVLDRVSRGEMPPKKEDRPPEAEAKPVLSALRQNLHDASLARQRAEGRVLLRRLNRTEYETTLADLLGTEVHVREMLPDDNSAAGFDNVSAVLDVSSAHLLRYQDAAEKALQGVIPARQPRSFTEKRTGKDITQKVRFWNEMLGKAARLDGTALVMHSRPYSHIPCASAPAPVNGRYRVRASVYAVNTDHALPVLGSCRDLYGRSDRDVRVVKDVPPGKPTLIEGEYDLKRQEVIVFNGWTLPAYRPDNRPGRGKGADTFAGPGLAVEWIEIEGPLDPWPPAGYKRLFADVPLKADPRTTTLVPTPARPREDADRLMRAFLPLAFRRPVAKDLQDYYVKVVHDALDKQVPFANAMLLGYKVALCSPHFLFLTEAVDPSRGDRATVLDDYALASRLSYFLWSSMPDAELLAVAAKGDLHKPDVLRAQTERMLADPKAARFTENFAGQWLDLRNINATSPDPQMYAEFDEFLFWSMPRETELFFEEILKNDRSLTEFTHSDWAMLNERLAKHYGIPGVVGGELRKVTLPKDSHRGGVLTQAAVLKVTADGTRTSPIIRGKWVLERIMGQPPAPPPPDTPAIEPDIRGATTIRQQLDKHRNVAACAACHKHIDPPGFALENFDVIGGYREFYRATRGKPVPLANYPGRQVVRGLDVEKGGVSPDGRAFTGIDDYKQILLSDKDQLARAVAQKFVTYGTGAEIQFADREVIEDLVAKSRGKNYGFRTLLHDVIQSRVFLNK